VICSLEAPMVSSIFICTNTLNTKTNYFIEQYGKRQFVESSIVQFLCTNKFQTNQLELVQILNAKYGAFSTLSVGSLTYNSLQTNALNLYDSGFLRGSLLSLSSGILFVDSNSIYTNIVNTSNLVSTTSNLTFTMNLASNYLYQDITNVQNNLNIVSSNLSTTSGLNMSNILTGFSTQQFFASSIQGNSVSSTQLFFETGLGSTMSTLTQQVGVLKTTQLMTSSFSGNLNDAFTLIIQTI
jgi:hypothetical protein